ncbi:VanZ family protein [Nocardia otitidiscaviarum]|uniref:VanZ family protein n=1 Tax=Nocardia otitidiscaviarum TaxID=1823 RepID=A0A516NEQ2_9NOCA|nr:VanZ family protein [Nocardia otitidiscaviarum]MCP9622635.1 VanZ family protein [Nocardia otitidiscaviarum]QDP77385.1 VanZ family protein [Nocardia otitidiscaviarum]
MRDVWVQWGHVLVAWAIAVPITVAGAAVLLRWRLRRGSPRAEALRHTVSEAAIALGTLPWIWMILTPVDGKAAVLLVPLRDLVQTLSDTPTRAVVQIVPNLIVFLPLGFFLPLRVPRLANVWTMVALGAVLSASLEFAQYAFRLGRFSSVDDVLMNAAGAGIGALLSAAYAKRPATAVADPG